MSSLIEKVKEWYSTILGLILMTFAVSSYYFDWPTVQNIYQAVGEFGSGLILVFTNPKELAEEALEIFKKKLGK